MKRILPVLLAFIALSVQLISAQETSDDLENWSKEFIKKNLVIDSHCDTVSSMVRGRDITIRNEDGHIDIPRMIEGGLDAQFFACFVYPRENENDGVRLVLQMLDSMYETARKDDRFVVTTTAAAIEKAFSEGKIACIPAIEGGNAIVADLSVLRMFHKLGIRYITLTWNNSNKWADASAPDQSRYGDLGPHEGLSELGVEIVKEMNRLGMIVDCSHVHDDTFWDVIEVTTKPIIISHSCVWEINDHFRNVKDDMLKALAKNGGVIGVNFLPAFLSKEYNTVYEQHEDEMYAEYRKVRQEHEGDEAAQRDAYRQIREKYKKLLPEVSISLLADHIEYIVKVAGIDHVGLGSDFDGINDTPAGLEDCTDLYLIVMELRKRGWSEDDLKKFLGGNFLRVIKANIGE